jgi:tetratricopeptide (TPR) repeat protein
VRLDPESLGENTRGLERGSRDPAPSIELAQGAVVDGYEILSPLGRGGYATVYSAYDPLLDRRVALKFLDVSVESWASPDFERTRLVREAQAMARLAHPNVVTIYGFGVDHGRVYIAMELVEGGTLLDWLGAGAESRSWRATLGLLCEVGEGLAAAHRAGLVHRDLKPENVLVGADGRPRITDFGLARIVGHDAGAHSARPAGSPGYMAPEQYEADVEVDVRADIFSFCATLYRALYGERAFPGSVADDIACATREGRIRSAPKATRVPASVRRVLLRGLAPRAELRPQSMHELLALLRAVRGRAPRWFAIAATGLCLAVGVLGVRAVEHHRARACAAPGDRLAGIWDASRKAEIESAFRQTGLSYAPEAWNKVRTSLDAYATAWRASAQETCMAARVRHEESEELFELQAACFEDRRGELRALVDVLAHADRTVVVRAASAARGLSPLSECIQLQPLNAATRLPTDAARRAEIGVLRGDVATAGELRAAGRVAEATELLRSIRSRVVATDYAPLRVDYGLLIGTVEGEIDTRAGLADVEQALLAAEAGRLDKQRARVQLQLAYVYGRGLGDAAEGHLWAQRARATLERAGGDARIGMEIDATDGWIFVRESKFAEAGTLFQRVLDRARDTWLDIPSGTQSGLGAALRATGRYEEALEHTRAELEGQQMVHGVEHPDIAVALNNLADDELAAGHVEDAVATASRALGGIEASVRRGELDARSHVVGVVAHTLAEALLRAGRASEAAEQATRARDVYRTTYGAESLDVASAETVRASALASLGRLNEAGEALADAGAIEQRTPSAPRDIVVRTLAVQAQIALEQHRADVAVSCTNRAIEEMPPGDPYLAAAARLTLARALKGRRGSEERARLLAEQARDAFASLHDAEGVKQASALLAL